MCTLLEEYYIKLPQTTLEVTAGNNQAYNLTTWHGTTNLKGMPATRSSVIFLTSPFRTGL